MKYILYALLLLFSGANAADLWREGKTYHVGDIVIFNEKYYEAIQTHTAHVNANWTPASTPVLWKEIERGENDPNECYDAATGGYISPCPEDSTDSLLYVNFDNHQTGPYSSTDFKNDWHISPPNSSGLSAGRLSIVNDPAGIENKVLRVTYAAGQTGGNSAMVFNVPLSNRDNTLWFQYRVMFDPDFIWVKGGKLPGLAGSDKPTGCIDNGTFDGFSARLMWREHGSVYGYFYYPDKSERCGDYFPTNFQFSPGNWYTITQKMTLNTPGKSDGTLIEYIDDHKVLDLSNQKWREGNQVAIDFIKMDTFFGGSTTDWAPSEDQYVYFDNFIVTTSNPVKNSGK